MIKDGRLELRHLRYFAAVVEELHFGRAAARLAVSQPTLSVQIRQLEAVVAATLFDRHTRQVALTDAGRVLVEASARRSCATSRRRWPPPVRRSAGQAASCGSGSARR